MNKQQLYKSQTTNRQEWRTQNRMFQTSHKEQQFYAHLNRLNNSRAHSAKSSQITQQSEYTNTFQKYCKNVSLIDRIKDTFDNGNITDIFQEPNHFVETQVFLHLPPLIKQNIKQINQFYSPESPQTKLSFKQPLNLENYSNIIAQIKDKPIDFQQVKQIKQTPLVQQTKPVYPPSSTVATHHPIQAKADLILSEIDYQKKRRQDCPLYMRAMQIKLNQLLDYIIGDDEDFQYLGLSLKDKSNKIIQQIHKFKGKTLDGWLVLVLIQIFFEEYKDLENYKLHKLREQKKVQQQRHEVHSQMDTKSVKSNSSSIKRAKYSQPNSKRNIINQDEWIVPK